MSKSQMSRSLAKEVVIDARGGASVTGDVVACSIAGSRAGNGVAQELVEDIVALLRSTNGKTSTAGVQLYCLAELLVLGTENHRDAIDGSLGNIVDAAAKSTTNVGNRAITI